MEYGLWSFFFFLLHLYFSGSYARLHQAPLARPHLILETSWTTDEYKHWALGDHQGSKCGCHFRIDVIFLVSGLPMSLDSTPSAHCSVSGGVTSIKWSYISGESACTIKIWHEFISRVYKDVLEINKKRLETPNFKNGQRIQTGNKRRNQKGK